MSAIASQITSLTIVYLTVYSGADQRKYQSSASSAFVRGIHRWPVNSLHKWPVKRKMFPFYAIIMIKAYDIGVPLLGRITIFLTGRNQRFRVGEDTSKWSQVKSGIPQNSVLSPNFLYGIATTFPLFQNSSRAVMLVDDTKLYDIRQHI